ncbi:MAG TPA: hypothetical protein VJH96_03815 [Patescibacteria group bacterium]|nr:hypothetical protein [Patescibacteria group bacterium]
MNYLKQRQFLARVNQKDVFQENIEKWEAHKKGILHRRFTIALTRSVGKKTS